MKYFVPVSLMILILFSGPVLALASAAPVPDTPVLVIAPPWVDVSARIAEAGGRIIGPVSAHAAVLAVGDGVAFFDRMTNDPGLLIRDGQRLAEICGVVLW